MKTGTAPGPSGVPLELIAASGGIEIQAVAEICQSPRWICVSLMGSKYSCSNLQGEG